MSQAATIVSLDNNEVIIDTKFRIYYDTSEFVPVQDIISALKAVESMVTRAAPKFIEAAYPGIKVYDSEIFIDHLESGSLDIEVILRQAIGNDKYDRGAKLVDDAKILIQEIISDNKVMNNLVVAALSAALGAGIVYATGSSTDTPASAPVTFVNNGVYNQSGTVVLSSDQIDKILDKLPQKKLAQDAVDFVKPAKQDDKASIIIDDQDGITQVKFEPEQIKKIPDTYEPPIQQEREKNHSNIDIYIYASDRDKSSAGWAGIVPDLFEDRVKFELVDGLSPDSLHGRRKVKADIIVHERYTPSKNSYKPYKVTILKTA